MHLTESVLTRLIGARRSAAVAGPEFWDGIAWAVNPTANPPVCRIQNYAKYALEKAKKEKEIRMKQKPIKEMIFGVRTPLCACVRRQGKETNS